MKKTGKIITIVGATLLLCIWILAKMGAVIMSIIKADVERSNSRGPRQLNLRGLGPGLFIPNYKRKKQ